VTWFQEGSGSVAKAERVASARPRDQGRRQDPCFRDRHPSFTCARAEGRPRESRGGPAALRQFLVPAVTACITRSRLKLPGFWRGG
jgi:hypothetical protein